MLVNIIVIGGGASGMVAAITAARRGASVTILERLSTCGKKILVTGNGRCNYYNETVNIDFYNSTKKNILKSIINDKNNTLVHKFFSSIGIIPRIKDGYYYPYSNQAVTILNALKEEIQNLGIKVVLDYKVTSIKKINGEFIINDDNCYKASKVIVASGGYAYYKEDEVNSYKLVNDHKIIKPLPALVQLKVDSPITKKWAGVRDYAMLSLYINDKYKARETGEIMLTNYGLSGICAMQLSGECARAIDEGKKVEIVINFVPELAKTESEMEKFLESYNMSIKKRTIGQLLDNMLNYKLSNIISANYKDKYYNNLSSSEKKQIISRLIEYKVKINGTNTFKEAQVTTGGVSLEEININTMESLKQKNLYIIGELLDVDGKCGGYNLGFAWISGILAGISSSGGKND